MTPNAAPARTLLVSLLGAMLLCAAGCVVHDPVCSRNPNDPRCSDGGDGGGGPDADAGSCGGCSEDQVCKAETGDCVACVRNEHCDDGVCDTSQNECVECLDHDDCTSPERARCNDIEGRCEGCDHDDHCRSVEDKPRCDRDRGLCGECLPTSAEEDCEGTSCHPEGLTCTSTPLGSVGMCEPCVADDECDTVDGTDGATMRCVAMTYDDDDHGTYCLAVESELPDEQCPVRFNRTRSRPSVGGVEDDYCAPSEDLTTCEGALDFGKSDCTRDTEMTDCGDPELEDGLCRNDGAGLRCTYSCNLPEDCPTGSICTTSSYCCTDSC